MAYSCNPIHEVQTIYDNTCNEFCCCYKDAAAEYLQKKIILPVYLLSLIGEKHHTDPAQHEHGPVGKTTEKNFQRIIDPATDPPQK